jgi:predicted nucleic acid-binding protein
MELCRGNKEMERGKEVIVVDASVIVKWFVNEEYTEKSLALRQSYLDKKIDIVCPQLLPFEVLNALRYNPEFGEEQVKVASEALRKYQLWLYPVLGELAGICVKNSFSFGISLYDSSYISLAEYLDAKLYTADRRVLDKTGNLKTVKHVSDFET